LTGSVEAIWRSQLFALVQAQLRTYFHVIGARGKKRSQLFSGLFGLLWYGVWLLAALWALYLPTWLPRETVEGFLPGVYLLVMGYWQVAPILTMSLGVSLDLRKVGIYPISIRTLFAVECLLRVGTGAEMLMVLGGLYTGLILHGSPHWLEMTVATIAFAVLNVFLSAGVRNFMERLFRRRHWREAFLFLFVGLTVVPSILMQSQTARETGSWLAERGQGLPDWVLPSNAAGRIALGTATASDLFVFPMMIAFAAVFGYDQFRRTVRQGVTGLSSGAKPAARGSIMGRLGGWLARPVQWLPDPPAALIEREFRYLWRSPRFRLPFIMGFSFGVLVWLPIMLHFRDGASGWVDQSGVTFISMYSFLMLGPVLFLNRFGFDRGGARSFYWLPLRFGTILLTKNLVSLLVAVAEVLLITAVARALGLGITGWSVLEAVGVSVIAMLYLTSIGNIMSVRFPVASNPDRVSRAGPGGGTRAAVQFFVYPLMMSPIMLAYVVRYVLGDLGGFFMRLAGAATVGAVFYVLTFRNCARYGDLEREAMLSQLTEGAAPLAAE
jgi:ABC-2 type transport system permease protein